MSQPYLAQITMFAGNFAPRSWALCDGQILPINTNQSLFSLLGTTYGGDGRTTFALPDLRGRAPVHANLGPGLSPYPLGAKGGQERTFLNVSQIPSHNHTQPDSAATTGTARANMNAPTTNSNAGNSLGMAATYNAEAPAVDMAEGSVHADISHPATNNAGGSQGHENRQPYLAINYIICVQGLFPPRN